MSMRFVSACGKIRKEHFKYGDLVFFGGDVLHSGAANTTGVDNYRFLIQGESDDFLFTDSSTYIPDKYKNK